MKPLMYADEVNHFYNATEGRAKFIHLPLLFDPAEEKQRNNATLTRVYEISHLTRKKTALADVQVGEPLSLVRAPFDKEDPSTMAIYTGQGQWLGLIEDDLLAFYIDLGYR